MNNIIGIILVMVLASLVTAGQQIPAAGQQTSAGSARGKSETAIRASVDRMVKGWNSMSGQDFAGPFAPDADYVVINGMRIAGRSAIANGHQGIFDTIYKGSTLSCKIEQLRFLRSDVALVHLLAELRQNAAPARKAARRG